MNLRVPQNAGIVLTRTASCVTSVLSRGFTSHMANIFKSGPPSAGSGSGEKSFSGPPAKADRLKTLY